MTPSSPQILVVGDAFVDRYWIGSRRGPSAEFPGDVVDIAETRDLPGGASNVAANLRALGAPVYELVGSGPTKNRLITNGVQTARWDENDRCMRLPRRPVGSFFGVIVSDYNKGAVTSSLIEELTSLDVPIFIDTKRDPWLYRGIKNPTFFPNLAEWQEFPAYHDYNFPVVRTEGPAGATLVTDPAQDLHLPAFEVPEVRSVCGAGDTVVAAYAYSYLLQGPWRHEALKFALAAAAIVVSKPYTSTASLKEITDVLRRD